MISHKKLVLALSGAVFSGLVGLAVAQSISIPTLPNVGTTDLIPIVRAGVPQSRSSYASAAQIAGVPGYKALFAGADAHGQTLTYTQTSGVSNVFAYATGSAITSVTITTDPNPGDGERLCYVGSGQATTSLTFTPNTGQTLTTATISAGVSNVPICLTYVASLASWFRST